MSIFPREILDNTTEVFKFKHTVTSKIIYTILLAVVIIGFLLLPMIKVDVYSSAQGLLTPDKGRVPIALINSGRIIYSDLENNKTVKKGDTILVLDNSSINEKLELSSNKIEDVTLFVKDLTYLTTQSEIKSDSLQSPTYQKAFLQYEQEIAELKTRLAQANRDFERGRRLYKKGVIARAEYESVQLEHDLALSKISRLQKQQQSSWQADLITNQNLMDELQSGKKILGSDKSHQIVTAPVSGTMLDVVQLEKGGYVNQGTDIAQISPDGKLIVECYVSPSDIGLLKVGNPAIFQIDAFNYNQWGLANGKIIEIGKDVEMLNGNPAFRVRCDVNKRYLQLKNGFKGNLKKGMTLNAQFILTERSLYQLLYDGVDDWLNPSRT
ncbi:MAG: HlyD family efflux transporter periplasmic adaptor subunit [Flavobacterium sp.]|uniref:HlyD family secretion protein n=1 Tax=Flavobacterium sp. TaxID=239 RepID=UPI0012098690|nr:HlyD family efflux transporter periplasmic adaptor subunit [Flavobacterium sp.]RZJ66944.1 MAG: HlyD family efflux transporter periplasmic adaptor subunit [Flavobacterium sp.]